MHELKFALSTFPTCLGEWEQSPGSLFLGSSLGRSAKPTSRTAAHLQPEQRPFKQQLPTGACHLPTPCLPLHFGISFLTMAGTRVQTGGIFSPQCLQHWLQTKHQLQVCSWGRREKKQIPNNLWNVFLLLTAPTLPWSGECSP